MIRQIRARIEKLIDSFGLSGEEMIADIASDYFEDYANYRETELNITNEEFLEIIKKISS
ncbi:MAG: hypothetical protein LUG51_15175 [Tannerellaceae bacterium]|nr:hypothetical protein [Tannerellaceae bacterium]